MDEKQIQTLVNELAKNLKTPDDLSQFDRPLKKISAEGLSTPKCPIIRAYMINSK